MRRCLECKKRLYNEKTSCCKQCRGGFITWRCSLKGHTFRHVSLHHRCFCETLYLRYPLTKNQLRFRDFFMRQRRFSYLKQLPDFHAMSPDERACFDFMVVDWAYFRNFWYTLRSLTFHAFVSRNRQHHQEPTAGHGWFHERRARSFFVRVLADTRNQRCSRRVS